VTCTNREDRLALRHVLDGQLDPRLTFAGGRAFIDVRRRSVGTVPTSHYGQLSGVAVESLEAYRGSQK
jgi:hypothetical protein